MRRFARFGNQGIDRWAFAPRVDPIIDRAGRGDSKRLATDLGLDLVALVGK